MELRDYVALIRGRWRLILAGTLLGMIAGYALALATPPVYQSSAKLFVRAASSDGSIGTAYTGSLFTQQRVKSYKEFVTSPTVTSAVADRLGDPQVSAAKIGSELSADANLDTVNLNIHARDKSRARAQRITQLTAESFRDYLGKLETVNGAASPIAVDIVLPAQSAVQIQPRPKLNLAFGALIGLAVGIAVAVVRERLDTRIKNPGDIETRFGLPTMAVVAFDEHAKQRPLIVHEDPSSSKSEAFRRLRTNLQFVDIDERPRSIVITSAVEGEGKTTTACNLAITLASAGIPVILVDGDLRRPNVGKYLGIEDAVGLTNVLIGEVELADAMQPWGSTGRLWALPAGILPPNPSELLGSRHMQNLIEDLEERALVLIDAPPLLPVTDGAVLAAQSSGALLVVRLGRTRREQTGNAVEAIKSVGAHLYGAVLNMAPTKGPDAEIYGYSYYGTYRPRMSDAVVPEASTSLSSLRSGDADGNGEVH